MGYSLGELARHAGARLEGEADCEITTVAPLPDAEAGSVAFLTDRKYLKHLASTRASAVILAQEFLEACPTNALVTDNPYLAYARVATRLFPQTEERSGRAPSAVIAGSATVDSSAWVGPGVVIEEEAEVGANVTIGPGCVLGKGCRVDEGSRLVANVTLCHGVRVGRRVLIHPGAVIGSDGFGLANDGGNWVKVPQLGSVSIGDDVEIGANTTIDRGALTDTVIEEGAKLDNQIQIAHNVRIGAHTAIAACVGIAGSTRVGRHCTLAGGVGLAGHLEIADNVHFSGQSLVTRSFEEPGYYSGNLPAVPNKVWRKTVARIRQLEDMARRLKRLERSLASANDAKSID